MSIVLRLVGILGVFLFLVLFSVTFMSPQTIEDSAKGFIKYQIEKDIRAKYTAISESNLTNKAMSIAERLGFEKSKLKADIENKLPEKIASIMAAMCGYDCEKKKAFAQSIKSGYLEKIKSISVAQQTLRDIVQGKYVEIVGNLKLDLRIFLGTDAIMFLLLLLISFFKQQAIAHLYLPALLLFITTIASSLVYIFGQDWFYTILYNDYMGWGYLVYIGVIFGLLMDIFLNKARVTTVIINSIPSGVSSLSPC